MTTTMHQAANQKRDDVGKHHVTKPGVQRITLPGFDMASFYIDVVLRLPISIALLCAMISLCN